MATDWVKMRTDIYRDHRVCMMAEILERKDGDLAKYVMQNKQRDMSVTRNVTRCATVGALVTLWGVTRHRGKRVGDDMLLPGCGLAVLDDIADLPGIGEAMEAVGWAKQIDEGVVLPAFFSEYNADPQETKRKDAAERQRRYREKKSQKSDVTRNVTRCATSDTEENRIEKNREESIQDTLLAADADSPPAEISEPTVAVSSGVSPPPYAFIASQYVAAFGGSANVTDKRRRAIRSRWQNAFWRKSWQQALDRGSGSSFLRGGGSKGWRITFDFFLKPDTVVRIMEGEFDDNGTGQANGKSRAATREDRNAAAFAAVFDAIAADGGPDGGEE